MSTPRRKAREVAFQILYQYDVLQTNEGKAPPLGIALRQDLEKHFQHFEVPDTAREFTEQLVVQTIEQMGEIDQLINSHSSKWKVSRMDAVDRSLLRIAVAEIKNLKEVPKAVTMNEIIEIAKQFGSGESASFINGILDALAKALEQAPA